MEHNRIKKEMNKHQRRVLAMIENGALENDVRKLIEIHTNIVSELELILKLHKQLGEKK